VSSGGATSEQTLVFGSLEGLKIQPQKKKVDPVNPRSKRVVVIAGPTATGKTSLSLLLSRRLDGEIVSADSMQVYRGMDIGTAKATPTQRSQVPHHLLDLCDVTDDFTVVDYYSLATRAIRDILDRGKTPILVGGSGFYIHTLIYGPPEGPTSVPEVREALEKEMERLGPEQMYYHLERLDPEYAQSITGRDRQKMIRALEIITLSGKPVSQHQWGQRRQVLEFDFNCWFLYRPRDVLYQRIEERCEAMLDAGLMEEALRLDRMGVRENRSASQAIGYRQCLEYLDSAHSHEDYLRFLTEFKKASRRYAKRQFTWFRKEPLFRWIDIDQHDPELAVDMMVRDFESLT
jgi:tRNA dimethylallyltransferase